MARLLTLYEDGRKGRKKGGGVYKGGGGALAPSLATGCARTCVPNKLLALARDVRGLKFPPRDKGPPMNFSDSEEKLWIPA